MGSPSQSIPQALVLSTEPNADSFLICELFCPNQGLLKTMKRLSKTKNSPTPQPLTLISAELSGNFIQEFNTLKTFPNIPKNFDTFLICGQWIQFLLKTLRFLAAPQTALFENTLKALENWNNLETLAAYPAIKLLASFAKQEGLPLAGEFIPTLTNELKITFASIITTPTYDLPQDPNPDLNLLHQDLLNFVVESTK